MNTKNDADSSKSDPETIMSALRKFKSLDALRSQAPHPFASSSESSTAILHELIQTAAQISNTLNVYMTMPFSNPKLISELRQLSGTSHTIHHADQILRQMRDAIHSRPGTLYGEDIPLDPSVIIDWCMERLQTWGTSVGMEMFKEEERDGLMSVLFGGKVLVLDIAFMVDRQTHDTRPRLAVSRVQTSYAVPNSAVPTSNTEGSSSLDSFLKRTIRSFLIEVQKDDGKQDNMEAKRLGKLVLEQLKYLMMLDALAARKEDGGVRWFMDVDLLGRVVAGVANGEAESVAKSLNVSQAPLDIFLHRAHGLPIPYLSSPSISFLTYLSPRAYLSILQSSPPSASDPSTTDISISTLTSYLASHPSSAGITKCSLLLSPLPSNPSTQPPISISLDSRPTFSLTSLSTSTLDHTFPQPAPETNHAWFLDFGEGVVMPQGRMRDIEMVVNPLGFGSSMEMGMGFGSGSWVDLLMNQSGIMSPERYSALYRSPSSSHPPLQLRLTPPEEPGFLLQRVKVVSMREVWGILEVVREQCWLNEILRSVLWGEKDDEKEDEGEATEEELQSILAGSIKPRKIPVNIYLPTPSPPTSDADIFSTPSASLPTDTPTRTSIILTVPERPPISGLVHLVVTYDETRARGVRVDVRGVLSMSMDVDGESEEMAEMCRRGGIFGLAGRVWSAGGG